MVNRRNFNFFALNAFFFIKCDAKRVVDEGGSVPMVYTHYRQIWNVELDKTMAHLMLKVLLSDWSVERLRDGMKRAKKNPFAASLRIHH